MEILFLIIPAGVLFSLLAFFVFELKAIKANKNADVAATSMSEKLENYNTINNAVAFGVVSYVLTLVLSISTYDPSYGLIHALLYIFGTTFIGSIIIFVIKIKKSLLIKVFASFLYGVPHMMAAGAAFLTSFILS
ncbi:MAG TPA: hypothetical protein EYG97_01470 [Arcobacter sp.]|nr:hypothetical protein [Arcobacter sp.]HIP55675.1 hypothetical protein [Arcobacter sp.]